MKNDCFGCTDRIIGCHARCEKYKSYTAERRRQREAQKNRVLVNGYTCDTIDRKLHEIQRTANYKMGEKSDS